ncbi:MAG: Ig-like domain-containing protein [Candidatus Omnitrophota bacterium]
MRAALTTAVFAFILMVFPLNVEAALPPNVTAIPDKTHTPKPYNNSAYTFSVTVAATDPNTPAQTLTYSITGWKKDGVTVNVSSSLPSGASLDTVTGKFSWGVTPALTMTVGSSQVFTYGLHEITFTVKNTSNLSTSTTMKLTIVKPAIATLTDASATFLKTKWTLGEVAGNIGDWYDNCDGFHAGLSMGYYPQADLMTGSDGVVVETKTLVGNASHVYVTPDGNLNVVHYKYMNPTRSDYWSGNTGPEDAYRAYISNNHYWHPMVGQGGGGEGTDLSYAMSAYASGSKGASGSETDELQKFIYTFAAFKPEVKAKLIERRANPYHAERLESLLMPTVQMIYRRTRVKDDGEYLSYKAHVNEFHDVANSLDMVTMANGINLSDIPPMVQLKVIDETYKAYLPGDAIFEDIDKRTTEKYFDTPASICRVWRDRAYTKRMVVSAEESYDINNKPLTYHWAVIRGDPAHVRINYLNEAHSIAEIEIDYHPKTKFLFYNPNPEIASFYTNSNLVSIGVFANNGIYYSAPGFVTSFTLDHEVRTYDQAGRILQIDYNTNTVYSFVSKKKIWTRDLFKYALTGQLAGWRRTAGAVNTDYTAEGHLVKTSDPGGRALTAAEVTYNDTNSDNKVEVIESATIWTYNYLTLAGAQDTPVTGTPVGAGYAILEYPVNGTLAFTASTGAYTYTPKAGYAGADYFSFKNTVTRVITKVTVACSNPVAYDQVVSTNQETSLAIALKGEDILTPAAPLTYRVISSPSHGSLSGTAPAVTYLPDTGYFGPDTITFVVNNGTADSNVANVSINVKRVSSKNVAPAVQDINVSTDEDTPIDMTLDADDAEDDPVTFAITKYPSHGALEVTGETVRYIPCKDFSGIDTFTYTANDGISTSSPATVTVTVDPVNDHPPVALNGQHNTRAEIPLPVSLSATDGDNDFLIYSIVQGPVHGTLSAITDGSLVYTPEAGYAGSDSFVFKALDGTFDSNTATVSITVKSAVLPFAVIETSAPGGEAPLTILFDGSGSTPGSGNIISYAWDFGDGTTGAGPRNVHTFTNKGTYHVTLSVTDSGGNTDTAACDIDTAGSLILDLRFEDDYKDSIPMTNGVTDSSPYLNHGMQSNNPVIDYTGVDGKAYNFAGSQGIKLDAIRDDIGQVFTVSCWMRKPALSGDSSGAIIRVLGADGATKFALYDSDRTTPNSSRLVAYDGGDQRYEAYTNTVICDNTWHHVAYVSDGVVGRLFVDGRLKGSHTVDYQFDPADIWYVVGFTNGWGTNITVDNFKMFNIALADDEVMKIYKEVANPDQILNMKCDDDPSDGTQDDSLYTNHGTASGTLVRDTDRRENAGGTYTFDGSQTIDLGAMINDMRSSSFTFAAWIKAPPSDAPSTIFSTDNITGGSSSTVGCALVIGNGLAFNENKLLLLYRSAYSGTPTFIAQTLTTVADDTWHHIAFTYDGKAVRLYVDGIERGSAAISTGIGGTVKWTLGKNVYTDTAPYIGSIDDIKAWSRVLSLEEIAQLFADRLPQAAFSAVPGSGEQPLTVSFDASATEATTERKMIKYNWVYGDDTAGEGMVSYHNYPTISGSYNATLTVMDEFGDTGSLTKTITVEGCDAPPVADFAANVTRGTAPLTVQFTDRSANTPTAWSWTFGDGINETIRDPSHTYTAVGNYTVALTASNSYGQATDTRTGYINVTANHAPAATNQTVSVTEDTAKAITLGAADADNETLSFMLASTPVHGTVTGLPSSKITYTPASNYTGADNFTFKATDGKLESNIAMVTINVTSVNDAPVVYSQFVRVIRNGSATIPLNITDNDGESALYCSIYPYATNGTIEWISSTPPIVLKYIPAAGYTGRDSFQFKVSNGSVTSNNATVTIKVAPSAVNTAPGANAQSVTTAENTAKSITLNATDADGDRFDYIIVTKPLRGWITGTAPNVTYTPFTNYNGPDSFTFKVNDLEADSNLATVSITVTAVQTAPIANNQTLTAESGCATAIRLVGFDPDGNPVTYAVLSQPSHGALAGTAPDMSYTSDAGYAGDDSFTFRVNDGTANSNNATVAIKVIPVNRSPVAYPQTISVFKNTPTAITLGATDADGDNLTYTIISGPLHGTLSGTGMNVTYTPDTGYTGDDSFTFKTNDGLADSAPVTVSIDVITAPARTYYVDATSGDDANDGLSEETPWKTIAKVNSASFVPGDSILFKRGEVWRESLDITSGGDETAYVTFGAYGSGEKPLFQSKAAVLAGGWTNYNATIWYTANQGIKDPYKLIIDGTRGARKFSIAALIQEYDWYWDWHNDTIYLYAPSDPQIAYSSIDLCDYSVIQSWREPGSGDELTNNDYIIIRDIGIENSDCRYGIRIDHSFNSMIINMTIETKGRGGMGIVVANSGNVTVSRNTITTPRDHIPDQTDGIQTNSNTGNIYEYNLIDINNLDPLEHCDCIQMTNETNTTVRYNRLHQDTPKEYNSQGLYCTSCHGTYNIHNNIIYLPNSTSTVMGIYRGSGDSIPEGENDLKLIAFNNVVKSKSQHLFHPDTPDVVVKNNIFINTAGYAAAWFGDGVLDYSSIDNNIYSSTLDMPVKDAGNYCPSFAEWQSRGADVNGINGDPLLDGEFRPLAGSPAIDNGIDLSPMIESLDIEGTVRPADGDGDGEAIWDIGAYEYAYIKSAFPSILIANLDGDNLGDIVIDFGTDYGIWARYGTGTWALLSSATPESMASGDIDGNGKDDIVIDFGPDYGIWILGDSGLWTRVSDVDPGSIVTGDLDGDNLGDIVIDFGTEYGIWARYGTGTWALLSSATPESMASGDIDGNGKDDIVIDFGPDYGIWILGDSGVWTRVSDVDPGSIVTGDLDGDNLVDIVIDFGTEYGIWARYGTGTWALLSSATPESMALGDIDGNGKDDIVIDFGPDYGIWILGDNGLWTSVSDVDPGSIVTGDLDGDNLGDIVIDFGSEYGIWAKHQDGTWEKIHDLST